MGVVVVRLGPVILLKVGVKKTTPMMADVRVA
jgi:hypothetical protein